LRKLWQELYLPSRRIWSGLATVWAVILLVNFFQREDNSTLSRAQFSASSPIMNLAAQQHWMNELLADRVTPPEAERPRVFSPKPRSKKTEAAAV
jgi:hypothetical protein